MQVTIEIEQADRKKLVVAAQPLNVQFKGEKKLGDKSFVTLSARSAADFFKLGRLIDKVTGNEFDETPASTVEEKKAKK